MRHTIACESRPRGVALCVEPPLGVRPTLPAARGSSQLAASAESFVTDAERSNRRFTCTSPMLRLRVMLNVPSQFSVRSYGWLVLCRGNSVRGALVLFEALWTLAEAFCLGQMLGAL